MRATLANSRPCAVLTGDIVNSSGLTPEVRHKLPVLLRQVGGDLRKTWPEAARSAINIFRGDSWQLLLIDPKVAIRAALFFRAGVIAADSAHTLDTRISLAVGPVDFVPDNPTEGDGPAFRVSGQALDALHEPFRLSFRDETRASPALPVVAALFDAIAQDWTSRQAQAVQGRLRGWNQSKIGDRFKPEPITQQSVARHLEAAHWAAVERALTELESNWQNLAQP